MASTTSMTMKLSYSISLLTRRDDGRSGVCTVFNAEAVHYGPDNTTPIGPLDAARNEALRLVAECGYASVDVEIVGYCRGCGGSGQVRRKRSRSMFAMTKCPTCKNNNSAVTVCPRMTVITRSA